MNPDDIQLLWVLCDLYINTLYYIFYNILLYILPLSNLSTKNLLREFIINQIRSVFMVSKFSF